MAKKRTALVLKKEYVGKKVKITIPRMGEVEFNANKAHQQEYENYSKMGFAHCFDEVEQVDATPEEVEAFKLAEASKKVVNEDDDNEDNEDEDEDDDNEDNEDEDEDDDNEDEDEDDDNEDDDNEKENVSDSDSEADLKDEVRPDKPTEEALNAMEWKDLKADAVARGMSVGGRTKRETIINFLLGK